VTVVECTVDPEAATIVTVDEVVDVVDEGEVPPPELAGADGMDCEDTDCAPLPQLCTAIPAASTRHKAPNLWIPLRPPTPRTTPADGNKSAQATVKAAGDGAGGAIELATEAEVESVRVALAEVAPGVMEFGVKL